MHLYRSLFIVLAFVLCTSQALAASTAQEVVMTTSDQVIARLRSEQQGLANHPEKVYALIDEIVLPHFDFVRMAALVLGKNWRATGKDQKIQFVREFRRMLVRTYSKALQNYTDEEIVYHPMHGDGSRGLVTVKTEIVRAQGPAVPIDYRMHNRDGSWKVFDVVVEGISLVSTHRSEFDSAIRQGGIDGLIADLKGRNDKAISS
ncbi:MAG: MlaC/ttg2D family ABC transporter substrate-binding protein [Gammaproteobacteria bacterium]